MNEQEFINIYKNDYMIDYKNENLIINKTSCYKVSKEVAFLIEFLPKKVMKKTCLEYLNSLEIANCESVFNKLISLGVLEEKQDIKFKEIIYKIFNPKIQILSSCIQEKLFKFRFLYKLKESSMLKITIIYVSLFFIIGLFFNNIYIISNVERNFTKLDFLTLIILMLLGIIFHELGHSYMCSYCGIGLRPICFSIYLIYPVMFTNVSGINELDLKQRVLVNVAGLFVQALYMTILIFLFFIIRYDIILECIRLLFTTFYFNFHPFMRTDGYWFFKDILYFNKDSKFGRTANNIYYLLYFLFSAYLLYKGILIIKVLILYFTNFNKIKLDVLLLINLFYMYLAIILFKAIKNRFLEFYTHIIKKRVKKENYSD